MGTVEVAVLHDEGKYQEGNLSGDDPCSYHHTLTVTEQPGRGLTSKVQWIFNPRIPFPHGCGVTDPEADRVLGRADEFDLIWFFKLRTPNMFSQFSWTRSVVDIDDVPSTYENSSAQSEPARHERFLARIRKFSWQRRERLLGERFQALTVCSDGDKEYLRNLGLNAPIHVIPNGFEKPIAEPQRKPSLPPRIGFIGLFDYFPNREGIHWFAKNCWPRIKRAFPDARLRLMGRGSDGEHMPKGPDIDGLGWLHTPANEISTWSAMAVPIRVGAGTRVKIAQSFSQKCPIISTTIGAYGYGAVNGREMFLADSAENFADACITAIRHPDEAARMADRAWMHFLQKWTWDSIYPSIWAAAEGVLRCREHSAPPKP